MAKITIKELESLTAKNAGRILREDGNLASRISVGRAEQRVLLRSPGCWMAWRAKTAMPSCSAVFNKDLYPALGKTSISSVDAV